MNSAKVTIHHTYQQINKITINKLEIIVEKLFNWFYNNNFKSNASEYDFFSQNTNQ